MAASCSDRRRQCCWPHRRRRRLVAATSGGSSTLVLLLCALAVATQAEASSMQQTLAQLMQTFGGANESAASDSNHFKLLEQTDSNSVLLGARNVVYNLSLSSMREQKRLEWPAAEDDVRLCVMKGKSYEQCQNYIRVLKLSDAKDSLLVCGTNAYKPRCRTYFVTQDGYELDRESPGEGVCPYQENQNVTSLMADGQLYSATVTQFTGNDGLIHRVPLRTEQFNPKQLDSPNFVSSFRYGAHVYFLFREIAIEHQNCGKTVYSRIARVCINDAGQARATKERWTSFVKARLNCSIPGEFPFYFDEIQAATGLINGATIGAQSRLFAKPNADPTESAEEQTVPSGGDEEPQNDIFYTVFTTPQNSIGGSAVCAYRMSDVLAAFDGPFKSQAGSNSNWLPVPESQVPQPRPGTCVNNSRELPEDSVNFIKDNPLMDSSVEPIWSQPLIMMASINFRFTQIAVDSQVELQQAFGSQSTRTDVIFVSSDDGRVFKLANTYHLFSQVSAGSKPVQQALHQTPQTLRYSASPVGVSSFGAASPLQSASSSMGQSQQVNAQLPDISSYTVVIEELHLFDAKTPITSLLIHYPPAASPGPFIAPGSNNYPKLLVLSGKQLKAIPLSRCERALTCADCLALYDPYCAWDTQQQACLSLGRSPISSAAMQSHKQQLYQSSHHYNRWAQANNNNINWFPANNNNLLLNGTPYGKPQNNHTLGWWMQCPPSNGASTIPQVVGAPYRSLFSSHLQVPNRFDYSSGHYLSRNALLSLAAPPPAVPQSPATPSQVATGSGAPQAAQMMQVSHHQTHAASQPVSECLTFCGGVYSPQMDAATSGHSLSCSDIQQHYSMGFASTQPHLMAGSSPNLISTTSGFGRNANLFSGNLYTSENLYMAVIICALVSLILGLVFGFAIGRSARKHDSSVCSSTFDETNLYMASTGSQHMHAVQQHQHPQQAPLPLPITPANGTGSGFFGSQRPQHSFGVSPSNQTNGLLTGGRQMFASTGNGGSSNNSSRRHYSQQQHLLASHQQQQEHQMQPIYNNQQQQMLLQLANATGSSDPSPATRLGSLPPLPPQQQQQPLVQNSTLINQSQLTPTAQSASNGSGTATTTTSTSGFVGAGSCSLSSASSGNSNASTSTSATVPANESHNPLINNQMIYFNQQQQQHQRSLINGSSSSNSSKTGAKKQQQHSIAPPISHKSTTTFGQQQQQHQQPQHLQLQDEAEYNKIYL